MKPRKKISLTPASPARTFSEVDRPPTAPKGRLIAAQGRTSPECRPGLHRQKQFSLSPSDGGREGRRVFVSPASIPSNNPFRVFCVFRGSKSLCSQPHPCPSVKSVVKISSPVPFGVFRVVRGSSVCSGPTPNQKSKFKI